VPTRQSEHPLGDQLPQLMSPLRRVAPVVEALGQPIDQTQPMVDRRQNHRAAVRAGMELVEPRVERLVEDALEQHTLCRGRVAHAKTSVREGKAPEQRLPTTRRSSCLYSSCIIPASVLTRKFL